MELFFGKLFWSKNPYFYTTLNISSEDFPTCDNCGKNSNKIIGKCFDCCTSLCEPCYTHHNNMKVFRSHKVFIGAELESISLPTKPVDDSYVCESHLDEKLKFYCETCEKFICRDCALLNHPRESHKFDLIGNIYEKSLNNLKSELSEALERIKNATTYIAAAETNLDEMQLFIDNTEKEINVLFDDICTAVQSRRIEALATVRPFVTRDEPYTKYIADVSASLRELQDSYSDIQLAIEGSSAIEILNNHKTYSQRLSILRRFGPCDKKDLSCFHFHPNMFAPLRRCISHIGRVTFEDPGVPVAKRPRIETVSQVSLLEVIPHLEVNISLSVPVVGQLNSSRHCVFSTKSWKVLLELTQKKKLRALGILSAASIFSTPLEESNLSRLEVFSPPPAVVFHPFSSGADVSIDAGIAFIQTMGHAVCLRSSPVRCSYRVFYEL